MRLQGLSSLSCDTAPSHTNSLLSLTLSLPCSGHVYLWDYEAGSLLKQFDLGDQPIR